MKYRKCISMLLALVMALALLPVSAFAAEDAVEIGTWAGLKAFAARVNGGETSLDAVLTADIAAANADWTPIGCDDEHAYTGLFDGCGHTITGLTCAAYSDGETPDDVYAGLFGQIGENGVVQNVGILDVSVSAGSEPMYAEVSINVCAGAVAGCSDGTIRQCWLGGNGAVGARGTRTGPDQLEVYAGGLVGYSDGIVRDCFVCGRTDVTADIALAGDYDYSGDMRNDSNSDTYAGGIVGRSSGRIETCYSANNGVISAPPGDLEILVDSNAGVISASSSNLEILVDPDAATYELLPGAEKSYTYVHDTASVFYQVYGVENEILARAVDTNGDEVTAGDSISFCVGTDLGNNALKVTVTVSPAIDAVNGETITWSHFALGETVRCAAKVTNTGSDPVSGVTLRDSQGQLIGGPFTLTSGGSAECRFTYTVTQADVDRGRIDLTVSAAGSAPDGTEVTAEDTVTIAAAEAAVPALKVWQVLYFIESVTGDLESRKAAVETEVFLKNTGNVPLHALLVQQSWRDDGGVDNAVILENSYNGATKVWVRSPYTYCAGAIAGSITDGSAFVNCFYDGWVCGLEAVGTHDFPDARLTTDDMTGSLSELQGFSSDVWMTRRWSSSAYYYPFLKGFACDQSQADADWPAKLAGCVVQTNPYVDITVTDVSGNPVPSGTLLPDGTLLVVHAVPKDGYRLKKYEDRDAVLYNDELITNGGSFFAECPCVISAEAEKDPDGQFALTLTCNGSISNVYSDGVYLAERSGEDVIVTGRDAGTNLRLYANVRGGSALWYRCGAAGTRTRIPTNPYVAPLKVREGETHYALNICKSPALILEAYYVWNGGSAAENPQIIEMTALPDPGTCTVLLADGGKAKCSLSLPDSYAAYLEKPLPRGCTFVGWTFLDLVTGEELGRYSGWSPGMAFEELEKEWQKNRGDVTLRLLYDMEVSTEVTPEGAGTAVFDPMTGVFSAAANQGYAFDHWAYRNPRVPEWDRDCISEENPWLPDGSVSGPGNYYNGVFTAVFRNVAPAFASHSLALAGKIGVNFFMDLSALSGEEMEESFMEFTVGGETTTVPIDPGFRDQNGNGYYGFTCYVNSIQMAEEITAVFRWGGGQTAEETYSVKAYLESAEALFGSFDETTVALIRALADYGHYAQLCLSGVNGWTIGTDYAEMDKFYTTSYSIEDVTAAVDEYAFSSVIDGSEIEKIAFTLVLDSGTDIRVYFKPATGYRGDFAVTIGDKPWEAVRQSDGRYLVTIPNVAAHQLDTMYTITVATDNGGASVSVSALSYVQSLLAETTDAAYQNAMAALYAYCAAARAYQAAHPAS